MPGKCARSLTSRRKALSFDFSSSVRERWGMMVAVFQDVSGRGEGSFL
jgi:hypothetical protein